MTFLLQRQAHTMPRVDFKPSAADLPRLFVRSQDKGGAKRGLLYPPEDDGNDYHDETIGNACMICNRREWSDGECSMIDV